MKNTLLNVAVVVALAIHPLQSFAHQDALAHVHEWHASLSIAGVVVVFALLLTIRRKLKR